MEIRFIKPKRSLLNAPRILRALHQEMYRFVSTMQDKIDRYPPQRATESGYIRSGALGRSWLHDVKSRPGAIIGRVGSDPSVMTRTPHYRRLKSGRRSKPFFPKRGYAPFVVGKKQSREMRGRGWKKVKTVMDKEWPGQVRRFQGIINRSK